MDLHQQLQPQLQKQLQQQVQVLIDKAPDDGKTPQAMRAIAPVLLSVAQQFHHPEYYVLQSLDQNLQIVTLQNRTQPTLEKIVIYAYDTLKNATHAGKDPNLMALPVPLTHLLFQLISLPSVDSLIFIETHAGNHQSLEIHQTELKRLLQQQLSIPPSSVTPSTDNAPDNANTTVYLA